MQGDTKAACKAAGGSKLPLTQTSKDCAASGQVASGQMTLQITKKRGESHLDIVIDVRELKGKAAAEVPLCAAAGIA